MHDIHKYLYALSAACFIGIGSGLLTLLPYALDYESKAIRAGAELEQTTGLKYEDGIECSEHPKIYADCYHATYLLTSNSSTAKFLQELAYFLVFVGFLAGVSGTYFHWRGSENGNTQ